MLGMIGITWPERVSEPEASPMIRLRPRTLNIVFARVILLRATLSILPTNATEIVSWSRSKTSWSARGPANLSNLTQQWTLLVSIHCREAQEWFRISPKRPSQEEHCQKVNGKRGHQTSFQTVLFQPRAANKKLDCDHSWSHGTWRVQTIHIESYQCTIWQIYHWLCQQDRSHSLQSV